jgi:microcystin-dependent protein
MDNFLGEIRIFAGNFAPRGWALCDGALLPIQQNTTLFALLGTNYGGDARTTFGLPNLAGSAPMHSGAGPGLTSRVVGEAGGSSFVTVTTSEMPAHNHVPMGDGGSGTAVGTTTSGTVWGSGTRSSAKLYAGDANLVAMSPLAVGIAGGTQPHNNVQPYLGLTFIIALEGIFPQRP